MKLCPECRRDYYDDTLLYCLDDGNALLEGPRSEPGTLATGFPSEEPATAILHETAPPSEAATRAQIHTTEQTAVLQSGVSDIPKARGFDRRLLLAPLLVAVIVLGGFFGYRYLNSNFRQIESIAVMPFVNESGNADVEYLSDGMTETLIKSLSDLPNLSVKGRSSVFRYKGKETDAKTLGKELGVQSVLYGRVIQRGEQLTLSLELLDTETENVIWSDKYDRKQSDLVSLQSEIAKDVSTKLKLKLSGADEAIVTKTSTVNPEAYQAYLKGRYYWNRRTAENIKKAIEQFKAATDSDPNFALAYVGLADCYAILPEYAGTPISETAPQAKSFAGRAIAIDDQLGEPHATLGIVNVQLWEWADAEREYKRAIELSPNYATAYHWYSILLKNLGRNDEAAKVIRRASELDPLSSSIAANISMIYQLQNNHEASVQNSLRLIELDPGYGRGYEYLGLSYLKLGRKDEAVKAMEKAVELTKRQNVVLSELGFVYGAVGKRTEALAVVKELEAKYARNEAAGREVAAVYSGLGERDKAFEWLEKDFQNRDGRLNTFRWETQFEPLRNDPRFAGLLKRMGLPE